MKFVLRISESFTHHPKYHGNLHLLAPWKEDCMGSMGHACHLLLYFPWDRVELFRELTIEGGTHLLLHVCHTWANAWQLPNHKFEHSA